MDSRVHIVALLALAATLVGCPDTGPDTVDPDVARLESQTLSLLNAERARLGLSVFSADAEASAVARRHSEAMAGEDALEHTMAGGAAPEVRLADAGVSFEETAEHIARVPQTGDPARRAVDAWLANAGHMENLGDGTLTRSGIGIAIDDAVDPPMLYFTHVMLSE